MGEGEGEKGGADLTRRTSGFRWAELTCARRAASCKHPQAVLKKNLRNTKNTKRYR